uniref:Uncharacterized protein n=1 Tax=Nelumbo nucifera TaxID=4432 RepID=A0A822Y1W8_NELNU|nr:TPA_asm: hypothetical protein HUJ06_026975 [Nelumbo nucifera]
MAQLAASLEFPNDTSEQHSRSVSLFLPSGQKRLLDERESLTNKGFEDELAKPHHPVLQDLLRCSKVNQTEGIAYVLSDDVLYRRGFDGLLLRCVGEVEADKICGRFTMAFWSHQAPQDAFG